MKKCCLILVCALLLCGCSSADTFETVADDYAQSVMLEERTVILDVDEDAMVLQGDTGTIYLCDGYEVTVEILSAGNLGGTFQSLTGFGVDDLTVIQTAASDAARYECVWSAVGEGGDVVGHAVVLDDGLHHYCVTAVAAAEDAAALQETWNELFRSFTLN